MTFFPALKKIWFFLNNRRKQQFLILLLLMVFVSIAEVVSVGAVIPFLGVLSNSEAIFKHDLIQPFLELFGITSHKELVLPITVIFIVVSILSGLMRIILLWAQTKLAHAVGADLGYEIYQFVLHRPYEDHVRHNSSETISAISNKVNQVVSQTIRPITVLISSFLIFIAICTFLFYVNPVVALSSIIGFSLIYTAFIFSTRGMLLENSKIISVSSNLVIKSLQEGIGAIRNIILDSMQNLYANSFHREDIKLRKATANNQIISQTPRYGVESLGMVLIAVIAFNMGGKEGDFSQVIPVLGAFAIGAQRMLPLIQQSYSSWSSIQGSRAVFFDVMSLTDSRLTLVRKKNNTSDIVFKKSIQLNDLSFSYKNQNTKILNGINFEIIKGSRIGFIGETGSGKSTLLDIIMCLLHPSEGSISVDGVKINSQNCHDWQTLITHIPQNIFLIDDTIAKNIAFGLLDEEIDYDKVAYVAKQAGISETIENLSQKYKTVVGERGGRLSGGQRQRIGIARALYKVSDVIILDEATSALDEKTENFVMNELDTISDDVTVIMVSHRISTMKNCDTIYELSEGRIKWKGSYSDLTNRNS